MGRYGVQRCRVGGRLDGPYHDLVIMARLVPEQCSFEWLAMAFSNGLEVAVDVDPYGMQWQA
jgi:hypothetical protein